MAKKRATPGISSESLSLFDQLIAGAPGIERKSASMPYTSLGGHMFSFLTPEGTLALRLSESDRDSFLKQHKTTLCHQHGRVMKEYVLVPDRLFHSPAKLKPYFQARLAYVGSLKPKPTKRIGKQKAVKKKVAKKPNKG